MVTSLPLFAFLELTLKEPFSVLSGTVTAYLGVLLPPPPEEEPELEGLVTNAEKGGVTVNYISKEDIEEIYKIRVALESIVLKEILKKDRSCLKPLHSILEETRIALDENMESEALIEIFQRFNHELYEVANLKQVSKLIKHLNEYTKRFRVLCLKDEIRLKEAFLEHCSLVEALEKKDLEEALRINDKHLFQSMKLVLNKMPDTK